MVVKNLSLPLLLWFLLVLSQMHVCQDAAVLHNRTLPRRACSGIDFLSLISCHSSLQVVEITSLHPVSCIVVPTQDIPRPLTISGFPD